MRWIVPFLFFLCLTAHAQFSPQVLNAAQLAIVINDDDPNSVAVGEIYRKARDIAPANVVHVHIPNKPARLDLASFRKLKDEIDAKLSPQVQAVLMIWTAPYAVECNGITSAYTLGFDAEQCHHGCDAGKMSLLFNAQTRQPYTDTGMRLSMLLPTESVDNAKALITRGVVSGFRTPTATAYFMRTSDAARNTRAVNFPASGRILAKRLTIRNSAGDVLEGAQDLMIYQTGLARVRKLDTLRFLPGALADHLTSYGGDLLGSSQMSSLQWLDAGATASYGTVSEPCNHWQKFPHSKVLLNHYLSGETAIEAYWKSVAWPAQGLFIGEPLAAPYVH